MNNKGFTLVEILAVVVLLGIIIIIVAPNISKSNDNTKKKLLDNKINQIKKVAVTYGQDNKNEFENECTIDGNKYDCIEIKVSNLIENNYINAESDNNIINPYNNKKLNNCIIQVYKKYGKIYAVWKNKSGDCWYE